MMILAEHQPELSTVDRELTRNNDMAMFQTKVRLNRHCERFERYTKAGNDFLRKIRFHPNVGHLLRLGLVSCRVICFATQGRDECLLAWAQQPINFVL